MRLDVPALQAYQGPFTDDTSVLRGPRYISDYPDGTASLRCSCGMAICGSAEAAA
jgi:succinate dehydrogenase/fumarate reductase-like Fe-S protein